VNPDPREIKIEDYSYDLPDEKIARYPLSDRDSSKLLVYNSGKIKQDIFRNISKYLKADHILVFNQTRVIRARMIFHKQSGAAIEIFCLEPVDPPAYEKNLSSVSGADWLCLTGNRKKWKGGKLSMALGHGGRQVKLSATEIERRSKNSIIRFSWNNKSMTFSDILNMAGHVPLPPYLNRADEEIDKTRYQTVYSREDGSVAAPTAGLHFTPEVLGELDKKGIIREAISLHVGAGTFVPVKSDTIGNHSMHTEHFKVERKMISGIIGRSVIAVGTTSLRTLESLYWIGHKINSGEIKEPGNIFIEQWYPYENQTRASYREYLEVILEFMDRNKLEYLLARTAIIIVPGYKIRMAEGLITNYHMPRSTLLLLVAALTGNHWRDIYNYSLENDFRFLSYGDSSLLLP